MEVVAAQVDEQGVQAGGGGIRLLIPLAVDIVARSGDSDASQGRVALENGGQRRVEPGRFQVLAQGVQPSACEQRQGTGRGP